MHMDLENEEFIQMGYPYKWLGKGSNLGQENIYVWKLKIKIVKWQFH